jgi:hypothetical protein
MERGCSAMLSKNGIHVVTYRVLFFDSANQHVIMVMRTEDIDTLAMQARFRTSC